MRVLVCGGRAFGKTQKLVNVLTDLDDLYGGITLIIHGCARGADTLAKEYARVRDIPVESYPADWAKHGKAAGPIRNREMLAKGKPDLVVAFPGGLGTANMVLQARKAGVPVEIID